MGIQTDLLALFECWRKEEHHKNEVFNIDGLVHEESWLRPDNKRTLFFLKEAHQGGRTRSQYGSDTSNLVEWIHDGVHYMWKKVAVMVAAIQYTDIDNIPNINSLHLVENMQSLVDSIAIVNVKKSNGQTSSNWDDIRDYTDKDKCYIKKQIDIIASNIIICGHNAHLLQIVLKIDEANMDKLLENRYLWFNGRLIIDYFHPANQYPRDMNYYTLAAIYQNALKEHAYEDMP